MNSATLILISLLAVPGRGAPRYAVKPLEAIGMPKVRVNSQDRSLYQVVSQVTKGAVLDIKRVERILRRHPNLVMCGANLRCVVKFGAKARVKRVVAGDISRLGTGFALSLRVVDVHNHHVLRRASTVVSGSPKQRRLALQEVVFRLLAPKRYRGTLDVHVDVSGARIFIDGVLYGTSPKHLFSVLAGPHALRVTNPAYHDFLRFVQVPFHKTIRVSANLQAFPILTGSISRRHKNITIVEGGKGPVTYRPLPWYRKWYVVTAVAVGAMLLAGTATGLAISLSGKQSIDADGRSKVSPATRP